MAYVYRFKDIEDRIIYVGYTGQQLSQRMNQHFTKGHLDKKCYNSIAKIEYQKYDTKSDAQIMEVVYINKYKPRYNKLNKQNDSITFNIDDEREWKVYRVFKTKKEATTDKKLGPFALVLVIFYILFILSYFIK